MFFLFGALAAAWPAFDDAIRKEWWRLAAIGTAALIAMLWFTDSWIGRILVSIGGWGTVCGLYGGLRRVRFKRGPLFRYLSDAIMPLFILHNAVVVAAGYYVMQGPMTLWAKAAILFGMAVAGPLAFYHLAIRPWPPMRLLFGAPRVRPR